MRGRIVVRQSAYPTALEAGRNASAYSPDALEMCLAPARLVAAGVPACLSSLDIFHEHWPVRPSLGMTRANGPDHISLGQRPGQRPGNAPGSRAPRNNPKRQRRDPISEIIERRMLVPHRVSKPFNVVSRQLFLHKT